MSERRLLALVAVAFAIVAERSAQYPPSYLAWNGLWSATAILASLACVAAMSRTRGTVALSGGLVVATSVARGVVVLVESLTSEHMLPAQRAAFAIGGTVWLLLAVMAWTVWEHVFVPWVALADRRDPDAN